MRLAGCVVSFLALLPGSFAASAPSGVKVDGKNIRIEFDRSLHSRAVAKFGGKEVVLGPFAATEFVTVAGTDAKGFSLRGVKREMVHDELGSGRRIVIAGDAPSLEKTVAVTVYDEFPRTAFFEVRYTNTGKSPLGVTGWTRKRRAGGGLEKRSASAHSCRILAAGGRCVNSDRRGNAVRRAGVV